MEEELWKDIPDYEGRYMISTFGRIKGLYHGVWSIKSVRPDSKGYLRVRFKANHKTVEINVHRLMGIVYLDSEGKGLCVNHKDLDKLNNRLDNLELVSQRENACHASKMRAISSSKYIGVVWSKQMKMWKTSIRLKGKSVFLGYYKEEDKAYEARCNAEKEHGIVNRYL